MARYVRRSAFESGGDLTNLDLLWYAKGVRKMMGRKLDDPTSWWFFAAIHGEYVDKKTGWYVTPPVFPDWQFIQGPPTVPTAPLPSEGTRHLFWNQCQHASWFFLPWHRGYLLAIEAQLRADIVSLGGPEDWALPYWNYFGGAAGVEAAMPPAFATTELPDSSPNPLYVAMRYGPDADRTVYIPTPGWEAAHPGHAAPSEGDVTNACLSNDLYTGADQKTTTPGFGGPKTPFSHTSDHTLYGNIESNPHNLVHDYTGGGISNTNYGLMSDPGLAALDPIFYLHHCNIDRMWASWNAAGNSNPTDPDWLSGPTTQHFVMPWPSTQPWYYTPMQVGNLADQTYAYDVLDPIAPADHPMALRLESLGAPTAAARVRSGHVRATLAQPPELLGASTSAVQITDAGVDDVAVRLDGGVRRKLVASLMTATENALPDRTYVRLEGVRGTSDPTVLAVFVDDKFVANVGLFGLRRASAPDGLHGGAGLTFNLDITRIVDAKVTAKSFDVGSMRVSLRPRAPLSVARRSQSGGLVFIARNSRHDAWACARELGGRMGSHGDSLRS